MSQQRDYIGEGPPGITSINVNGEVGKNLDVLILQMEKSLPSQLIYQMPVGGHAGGQVQNRWLGHGVGFMIDVVCQHRQNKDIVVTGRKLA